MYNYMLYVPVLDSDGKSYDYYPTHIRSYRKTIDINNNEGLRERVTLYFLNRIIDIVDYTQHKYLKKHKKMINSKKGYKIIYNILRIYIKKTGSNWYDLRDLESDVIKYILYILESN